MTAEENIVRKLVDNFELLNERCHIQRERRIFAEVPKGIILEVISYAKEKLDFSMLCTITGLDLGEELQAIYHLTNNCGMVLSLKINVPKDNPVIESVTPIYRGASFYERELVDMFGFEVKELPPGYRYPLPDWWPVDQHPLRKDWKPDGMEELKGRDTE
jgi:NADH:ubiquinone oxidoreductase 27 kD subunit